MQTGLVGSYSFFFPSEVRKAIVAGKCQGCKCRTQMPDSFNESSAFIYSAKTKHMSCLLGVLQVSTCPWIPCSFSPNDVGPFLRSVSLFPCACSSFRFPTQRSNVKESSATLLSSSLQMRLTSWGVCHYPPQVWQSPGSPGLTVPVNRPTGNKYNYTHTYPCKQRASTKQNTWAE